MSKNQDAQRRIVLIGGDSSGQTVMQDFDDKIVIISPVIGNDKIAQRRQVYCRELFATQKMRWVFYRWEGITLEQATQMLFDNFIS